MNAKTPRKIFGVFCNEIQESKKEKEYETKKETQGIRQKGI